MNNCENQHALNCIIEELEQLKITVKELEEKLNELKGKFNNEAR